MTEKDTLSPQEMREKIEKAIYPLEGEPIHKRHWEGMEGYAAAAESAALAMLITAEEDPDLLDVSKEEEDDESGFKAANNMKLWEATKKKFPGLDEWLGGITGFQFGWAHGAVRYIKEFSPVGNPAIVTIGKD